MATGYVYDSRYLLHHTAHLPERPERLAFLQNHLAATGLLERLTPVAPRKADLATVRLVHTDAYLKWLRKAAATGLGFDSTEVVIGQDSYPVALLAAGGVLAMCDAVLKRSGGVTNGFCAVRPPGHHASAERAAGFCLLNNVAIAARYLQKKHRIKKVAIVDWDLHHGDGTQAIFAQEPSVLFVSLHEHPAFLYPGSGYAWEKGQGLGEGFTLNIPMQPEADDADYQTAFTLYVLPALRKFAPEVLLISAGFDAHMHDPLGHLRLTSVGYAWMTRQLKNIADTFCGGRLISVLEGGYNEQALAWSVQTHLEVLLERTPEEAKAEMKAGIY